MEKPGLPDNFPEGKLNKPNKEELRIKSAPFTDPKTGEVKLAIALSFPVAMFTLGAEQATDLAKTIRKQAKKIIRGGKYQ